MNRYEIKRQHRHERNKEAIKAAKLGIREWKSLRLEEKKRIRKTIISFTETK